MKKLNITISTLLILLILCINADAKNNTSKSFVDEVDLKTLKSTKITPVLDSPISTDENLIYCSTFQMAWNELCIKYAKDTLEIEKAPDYVEKLNALYKQQPLVSEDSYLAMSGTGKEKILDKINEAVVKKFGFLNKDELPPKFNFYLRPEDIVAFAYLYKNLEFKKPFDITKPIYMTYQKKIFKADTFGFDRSSRRNNFQDQFEVLYYKPKIKNNYKTAEVVIKLVGKNASDEVIISTLPAGNNMKEAYDCIDKAINSNEPRPFKILSLQIPKINFNFLHKYNELIHKKILNKTLENYTIECAIQKIAFNLNENGAKLMSYALITCFGSDGRPAIPIKIECPFVIYLKDKTKKLPYFMAYISNPELLVKNKDITISEYDEIDNEIFDSIAAELIAKNKDNNDKVIFDAEIGLNPILKKACRYYAPDLNIHFDLKFINARVEDDSNTLLLALKRKKYIQSQMRICYKKIYNGEKSKIEECSSEATKKYYYNLIEYLIKNGAEINSSNNSGLTPLICAVDNGDFEIVKLLLESGADIKAKRKDGKSALAIAKEKKNEKIIKLLLKQQK